MPNAQETALLTVYRTGNVNLNHEATRVLTQHGLSFRLLPPTNLEPRWFLLPATQGLSGDVKLHGRTDRWNLRFRAPTLAIALFAALPAGQSTLSLLLEPSAAAGFRLVAQ
jgi:hypothetical protein